MEKKKPHYLLTEIKAAVARMGSEAFTQTAKIGVAKLGLSMSEALATITALVSADFYKSMTTHTDHTQWQDVYYAACPGNKTAYLKFTLRDGAVVIQFKEK
ncbi:MAG: type II toxin-antitoxin system MqsR family toxin [Zoogloeaceae bacterium]|nr:type II toxin-antitoxin system MqsR family toxin [Zoogloeaceae bacterium]